MQDQLNSIINFLVPIHIILLLVIKMECRLQKFFFDDDQLVLFSLIMATVHI